MPNPIRLAVIANAHFDDVRLPFPPAWMQKLGLAMGAPVGRMLGFKQAPLMNISRLRFLYYKQHYSIAKSRRELGYTPRITYAEGLPITLDWFRAEGLIPQRPPTGAPQLSPAGG